MCVYSSTPLSKGDMFQDPQRMPETVDSIEAYTYDFSQTYIPVVQFNL